VTLPKAPAASNPQISVPAMSPLLERLLLATGVLLLFCLGYFSIGFITDTARARDLTLTPDRQIPFISEAVWIYLSLFPIAVSPLLLVRSRDRFRRTALAYAIAMGLSFVCFASWPVSSHTLRMPLDNLNLARVSDRAVALLYGIDPSCNLFPSLHVSIVVLALLSILRSSKLSIALAAGGGVLIAASACLIKQHFVVDVLAGLLLGLLIGLVMLAPRRRAD
jgi:membrane-associated phospholipid phosphatase